MTLLYIIYSLLGISVIIFLHELGHFLAAKRVGVRVERFCVGFDPPIRGHHLRFLSFKRGETEYAIGMIPFGGYVKMAGETDLSGDTSGADDELMSKSVGARALVFVAGAAMNVASAFLFFIAAFSIGVKFVEPQIGSVLPGGPAWEQGFRTGDKVLAIEGEAPIEFTEVNLASALGRNADPVRFTLERAVGDGSQPNGATQTVEVDVRPRWSVQQGFNIIGVTRPLSSFLRAPKPESVAARAGLVEGDELTGLRVGETTVPVTSPNTLAGAIGDLASFRSGEAFEIRVRRQDQELWLKLKPERDSASATLPRVGIQPGSGNVVRALQPGSAAAQTLQIGDEVLQFAGKPITTLHWLTVQEALTPAAGGDGQLTLLVRRAGSGLSRPTTELQVDGAQFLGWILRDEIQWTGFFAALATEVSPPSLGDTGLLGGDTIVEVNGAACYTPTSFGELVEKAQEETIALTVRRGGNLTSLEAKRTSLLGLDLTASSWQSMPPVDAVMQDGPAAQAGFTPGSVILAVNRKRVHNWGELLQAVGDIPAETAVPFAWLDVHGQHQEADLRPGVHEALFPVPIGVQEKVVRAGIAEAVRLGARRTIIVSKWVFLTLRSLFRREVSAKNLQGPIGIAHVLTKVSEQGLGTLIYFLAIISVNLGLFNLLPFPILDGGHLFFLLIEKIKGSPVDIRIQEWATNIAFLMIISLAIFVTFNDLTRLLR